MRFFPRDRCPGYCFAIRNARSRSRELILKEKKILNGHTLTYTIVPFVSGQSPFNGRKRPGNLRGANIFMVDRRYRWVSPALWLIVSGHASPEDLRSRKRNRIELPEATCFINMGHLWRFIAETVERVGIH